MTLDLSQLQGAIFKLEDDIGRVKDDIAHLRQFADAASESDLLPQVELCALGLKLPPEIVVGRPDEVAGYLIVHGNVKALVREMAAALVEGFRGERSEIELALYQDPEIDDRYLTFYVRVPEYDDSLMPRLDAISEEVESRFAPTSESVLVTTDHHPIA